MKTIETLSGKSDNSINYLVEDYGINVKWGKINFLLKKSTIDNILGDFFISKDKWYDLGACVDNPIKGELGEYLNENFSSLTPRHASAIAPIMKDIGFIEHRIVKRRIQLRKL